MFTTIKTLVAGANARAEGRLRDTYSIELIEQKIREATATLKGAKLSLAGLIQRKRVEQAQMDALQTRIDDLMVRAKAALEQNEEALAREAAETIAQLEHEAASRKETLAHMSARIMRLESSVTTAHRRLQGLKQGALTAKTLRREARVQNSLGTLSPSAMDEAEELISNVMQQSDPFETSEILRGIDANLTGTSIEQRMQAKGLGPRTTPNADDILAKLKLT